jgi:hypothetical protein
MSFVQVGGDSASRPTYFELIAADQLVPSLKSAIVYTLSVLSQRYPWLHRVLDFEDEVLAALMLLIDWHSLSTCDATFAEGLYGLRRGTRRSAGTEGKAMPAAGAENQKGQSPTASLRPAALTRMTAMQRLMSLIVQVCVCVCVCVTCEYMSADRTSLTYPKVTHHHHLAILLLARRLVSRTSKLRQTGSTTGSVRGKACLHSP